MAASDISSRLERCPQNLDRCIALIWLLGESSECTRTLPSQLPLPPLQVFGVEPCTNRRGQLSLAFQRQPMRAAQVCYGEVWAGRAHRVAHVIAIDAIDAVDLVEFAIEEQHRLLGIADKIHDGSAPPTCKAHERLS